MTTNRIPKQVTKAPSGAAVSSMPLHVADVPLETAMVADVFALHALDEAKKNIQVAQYYREEGEKNRARFYLNKAAEFRAVYQAFTKAIDVMGGLS
ncbi:hypothetical protein [Photobacterium nomapromontoriensis]|uniref:hypothetical protein n=1 Tax=Photobacterium nomapromontoriensis TaxID=2910237 RepID=UPI003D097A1E